MWIFILAFQSNFIVLRFSENQSLHLTHSFVILDIYDTSENTMDLFALNRFKTDVGLPDSQIFLVDKKTSLADSNAKTILASQEVMDFYTQSGEHLGFIDGGFWLTDKSQNKPSSATTITPFQPSSMSLRTVFKALTVNKSNPRL
jgi:hypothetical protein